MEAGGVSEVIFALSATMEGDTTAYYLYKKLKHYPLNFSVIARGIAVGDELEYADEVSLGRSIKIDYRIRNKNLQSQNCLIFIQQYRRYSVL